MEILYLILSKYLLGYFLQGLGCVLGIYAFCRQKADKKRYWIAAIILTAVLIGIRLLPINFGVHTLIGIIAMILLGVNWLKLPITQTTISSFLTTVAVLVAEFINVVIWTSLFGTQKVQEMLQSDLLKAVTGIPSNVIFFIIIAVMYYLLVIRKCSKDDGKALS